MNCSVYYFFFIEDGPLKEKRSPMFKFHCVDDKDFNGALSPEKVLYIRRSMFPCANLEV